MGERDYKQQIASFKRMVDRRVAERDDARVERDRLREALEVVAGDGERGRRHPVTGPRAWAVMVAREALAGGAENPPCIIEEIPRRPVDGYGETREQIMGRTTSSSW